LPAFADIIYKKFSPLRKTSGSLGCSMFSFLHDLGCLMGWETAFHRYFAKLSEEFA